MQDRVRRFRVFLKLLDGLRRGANNDLYAAPLGLGHDFVHDRQLTVHACADHQALGAPLKTGEELRMKEPHGEDPARRPDPASCVRTG
ncbi:MAG TPA: hypothetical protein VKP69_12230, partial [Isosphaeraceae bacterium]|nr:hypothetical protein [Isosphaeraceae bacterium]